MLLLRHRFPSRHRHDVRQKRRNHPVVLLRQMQKELAELQKRRAQAQVDQVLRQRRERKRLKPPDVCWQAATNHFFHFTDCGEMPKACFKLA